MHKGFQIIDLKDNNWAQILERSSFYDFYHTQSYHKLETEGTPKLFVTTLDDDFIAFPLIIRPIFNTDYFDCTSVYGYCGPISNNIVSALSSDIINQFTDDLKSYFEANNIIACFSRLHPIFGNDKMLGGLGKIIPLNKTIAIDITLPIDEQKRKFRKSNKYEINKLKKSDFTVKAVTSDEDINTFIDIYAETMARVNAAENYLFDKDYFYSFLKNPCFNAQLLVAVKDDEITAGAIFTITNKVMQYHLAGTKAAFSRQTPMKLILDEARLLANELDLEYLHLGGGVGGSDEDSLYRFKAGFSDQNFRFKIWQYISNQKIYDDLVTKFNQDLSSNFFPLYRV